MHLKLGTKFCVHPVTADCPQHLVSSDKIDEGLVEHLIYSSDVVSLRSGKHIPHPQVADWEFPGETPIVTFCPLPLFLLII